MKYLLVILFFIQALQSSAQDSLILRLHPTLLHENLILNKKYTVYNDTISISSLKFYLSDIALYQDEKPVFLFQKKYHLYDIQDSNTFVILETIPASLAYNTIKFSIGIDSTTNVSGAIEGSLDPMFGMYWTWQSGYINFKLEGIASRCPCSFTSISVAYRWLSGSLCRAMRDTTVITAKFNFKFGDTTRSTF